MPQPEGFTDTIKWYVWRCIRPLFPSIRDTLTKLHILRHSFRQEWHIGWLAPGRSINDFAEYLKTKGFTNHFIAWIDSDEVLGLRKCDGFKYQYHVRLFSDREIRGHYEKTPEAHPIKHFNEETFEPRTDEFKQWFGNWTVYEPSFGKTSFQSSPATSREVPYSG